MKQRAILPLPYYLGVIFLSLFSLLWLDDGPAASAKLLQQETSTRMNHSTNSTNSTNAQLYLPFVPQSNSNGSSLIATSTTMPMATATSTPTATPTASSTPASTPTSTPSATVTPTATPTATATNTTTPTPLPTSTDIATSTPIPMPTNVLPPSPDVDNRFAYQLLDTSIIHGRGLNVVDIDGDGDQDIISALNHTDAIHLYRNAGTGNWWVRQRVTYDDTIHVQESTTGDFDGDGDLDIAAIGVFQTSCTSCSAGKVAWYENPGSGGSTDVAWTEHLVDNARWGAYAIASTDLSGDGQPDLVVSTIRVNGRGDGVYWYRNDNSKENEGNEENEHSQADSWSEAIAIDEKLRWVEHILVHDLNGDGFDDIIASTVEDKQLVWYEHQLNDGKDISFTKHIIDDTATFYQPILADVDGDEIFELVVVTSLGIFSYDPGEEPSAPWTKTIMDGSIGSSSERLFAADLDNDADIDISIASKKHRLLGWYRNDGNSWGGETIQSYDGLSGLTGGDLNGDGQIDLITSTYDQRPLNDELVWWRNR